MIVILRQILLSGASGKCRRAWLVQRFPPASEPGTNVEYHRPGDLPASDLLEMPRRKREVLRPFAVKSPVQAQSRQRA